MRGTAGSHLRDQPFVSIVGIRWSLKLVAEQDFEQFGRRSRSLFNLKPTKMDGPE